MEKLKNFDEFLNEAKKPSYQVYKIMEMFEEMGADEAEELLFSLADSYSKNAKELTNMDAKGIAHHIEEAAKLIKKRTGN